ncbi:MAG: hypothetical protein HY684_06420 [Chloroflexi bacterium]|nr:hypothetical protein [Chloroflexota bacterium]
MDTTDISAELSPHLLPREIELRPTESPEAIRLALDPLIKQMEELRDAALEAGGRSPAFIVDLNQPDLKLNYPLFVLIERWHNEVTVRSPELRVISQGQSEEEAILAFKDAVAELYRELKNESRDSLGPSVKALQSAILALISER